MRTRIDALNHLLANNGDCDGKDCSQCFFGMNTHQCSITQPYRHEAEFMNQVTGKHVKSAFMGIKYAYANLYHNKLIVTGKLVLPERYM